MSSSCLLQFPCPLIIQSQKKYHCHGNSNISRFSLFIIGILIHVSVLYNDISVLSSSRTNQTHKINLLLVCGKWHFTIFPY